MANADALEDALARKGGLTLSQLVDYDDRLTDALIDRVYYWSTIRKLRPGYHASRGVREEDVTDLIQKHVILNKNHAVATQKLLDMPALKRYYTSLKTLNEKEHFTRHLSRYVRLYLPDCPFEVSTTNRYTVISHEASIIARRELKRGEVIKYLCGIKVAMTRQEEQDLGLRDRDFSIVLSSRKKLPSLFLGPARFSNHDCAANARLSTIGPHGMQVIAVRRINVGEEITVSYGDGYFGEDNCECLCMTCETHRRNGWARKAKEVVEDAKPRLCVKVRLPKQRLRPDQHTRSENAYTPTSADEQTPVASSQSTDSADKSEYSLRRKRRHTFDRLTHARIPCEDPPDSPEPDSPESPPDKRATLRRKRRFTFDRLTHALIPCTDPPDSPEGPPAKKARNDVVEADQRLSTRANINEANSRTDTSAKEAPREREGRLPVARRYSRLNLSSAAAESESPAHSISPHSSRSSRMSHDSTAPTSVDGQALDDLSPTEDQYASKPDPGLKSEQHPNSATESPMTTRQTLRSRSLAIPTIEAHDPTDTDDDDDDEATDPDNPRRRPGDYTLTRRLLPTAYSRWVECRTCNEHFVQDEAFLTRIACPRCERHSKLYGYPWPKTDKEGRKDTEERVLDHRTVHRFVSSKEELQTRKGRKTLDAMVDERRDLSRKSESSETRRRRSAG